MEVMHPPLSQKAVIVKQRGMAIAEVWIKVFSLPHLILKSFPARFL
jgi:hypothetical protein